MQTKWPAVKRTKCDSTKSNRTCVSTAANVFSSPNILSGIDDPQDAEVARMYKQDIKLFEFTAK